MIVVPPNHSALIEGNTKWWADPVRGNFAPNLVQSARIASTSTQKAHAPLAPPVSTHTIATVATKITQTPAHAGSNQPPITHLETPQPSNKSTNYPLPTPIKAPLLARLLQEYPDKAFICNGLINGFEIGYDGSPHTQHCNNNLSVNSNPEFVQAKLDTEISLSRIAGPFDNPPLENFMCSPLSIKEKSTKGKYRLLHNLSYPHDSSSVNHNIGDEHYKLKYATVEDAINLANKFNHCYMAKADIADAYRNLPLSPTDYNLVGFKFKGKYYHDKCLVMGARSSCKTFERFSSGIKWILRTWYKVDYVVKMLDDFLFLAPTATRCAYALDSFKHLCKRTGIPLAEEKTVEPTQVITFLGLTLNTISMEASIPPDKVARYLKHVKELQAQEVCSLKHFKSAIGKLQFASVIVPAGRCFLRRMHNATIGLQNPNSQVRLIPSVKEDLKVWEEFLQHFNGKGLMIWNKASAETNFHMYSDSSLTGYGSCLGTSFICGTFPDHWKGLDIQTLELYPILATIGTFAHHLKDKSITIHTDNQPIAHSINNQTSRNKSVMVLMRRLVTLLLVNNIRFRAEHIEGKKNIFCDQLSRQQISPSLLRQYGMEAHAKQIPPSLLPQNFFR